MTYPRRATDSALTTSNAPSHAVIDGVRHDDAPLVDYVVAGGVRGFTPEQMFPERAA